jgi:hypothetical protein
VRERLRGRDDMRQRRLRVPRQSGLVRWCMYESQ